MDTPASPLPALFLSHGSPMIALEPGAAGAFMQRLGPAIDAAFGRPRAILAISPHTAARRPVLLAAPRHEAVHDFGGFDAALHRMRYDAPGSPALADAVQRRLGNAGIEVLRDDAAGGLDHGIWVPLRYLWPQADVPVLPLALVPFMTPAQLFELGRCLAPLREEGVLVLATGSITHNLRLVAEGGRRVDLPERPESAAFRAWMHERAAASDREALFDYRRRAPHAAFMHPTDEHLLPFYVAAGAGGLEPAPLRLHESVTYGVLGMDAYAFGPESGRLARALDAGAA
ncbi:DODA-type extradiol aromatic ring-opening family dioxygenase [Caldimonas tepidiphila]|uniref:DODA-type extradiol aromatic ring-opening family dioxygenase n=1 Tax=Caldimonas tepidiphila TaxID=2315841 RepID=UPI000E5B6813|nr:class III extradiol ring-cleavage dioxygenase [Caldimonas tepidiphila]